MKSHALFLAAILAASAVQTSAATMAEDTDGNGSFSMEEMTVAYPDLTEETFADIDTDESGDISEEELTVAMESGLLGN